MMQYGFWPWLTCVQTWSLPFGVWTCGERCMWTAGTSCRNWYLNPLVTDYELEPYSLFLPDTDPDRISFGAYRWLHLVATYLRALHVMYDLKWPFPLLDEVWGDICLSTVTDVKNLYFVLPVAYVHKATMASFRTWSTEWVSVLLDPLMCFWWHLTSDSVNDPGLDWPWRRKVIIWRQSCLDNSCDELSG